MTIPRITYDPGVHLVDDDRILVDLDKLVASNLQLQCQPGGGKSWALRQLMEECFGRIPIICIDTEDEFHTLRERYDFLLGAPRGGDFEATPNTVATLTRRLIELRASAVISIFDLPMHEKRRFVRLFCETLMTLPKSAWGPTLIPIDEIHIYGPERGHGEAESLEPLIDLGSRGRKRGFCLIGATQRGAKFNKDVAATLNNKLIGVTTLDIDQKRAIGELGFEAKDREKLRMLKPGQFYAFGPAISQEVVLVQSGTIKTTHPKAGQTVAAAAAPPSAKLKALIASSLADLPKEAEQEAKSLDELRAENAKLKRDLGAATSGRAQLAMLEGERAALRTEGARAALAGVRPRLEALNSLLELTGSHVATAVGDMGDRIRYMIEQSMPNGQVDVRNDLARTVGRIMNLGQTVERIVNSDPKPGPPVEWPALGMKTKSRPPSGELVAGEQRILDAVAMLQEIGVDTPTRGQVGIFAGYNLTAGGKPGIYTGNLIKRGLLAGENGTLSLTPEGDAKANHPDRILQLGELHASVLSRLKDGEQRILRSLIHAYPAAVSREQVGKEVGYNLTAGGKPGIYAGHLIKLEFAQAPQPGYLKAGDVLFPKGLR